MVIKTQNADPTLNVNTKYKAVIPSILWHPGRSTNRPTDRHIYRDKDSQTERQTDSLRSRSTDEFTDRHTDREID